MEQAGRSRYLDFAYQHLGKCVAEQGRFEAAIECFGAALAMRSDGSRRESSRRAIEAAEKAIDARR